MVFCCLSDLHWVSTRFSLLLTPPPPLAPSSSWASFGFAFKCFSLCEKDEVINVTLYLLVRTFCLSVVRYSEAWMEATRPFWWMFSDLFFSPLASHTIYYVHQHFWRMEGWLYVLTVRRRAHLSRHFVAFPRFAPFCFRLSTEARLI